ncbi:MAG: hypothetical protein KIT11_04090 [Fimbriimonadaceae bacterium]|nr:hypothetical protein [Fimbriimonadaceae bacterium]QYK56923.1 MAG: hypothetical protein KF733_05435 [Fimbriimonadaceae bacterium]
MRENYTLHKLHSLSGIIPTGFYLLQHLTLNTFSLAGPERFNGVIGFFEGMPKHVLYGLKALIWIPLIFHAVYGLFIVSNGEMNQYATSVYKFRENRYYWLQRVSGIVAFFFLAYHMTMTSVMGQIKGAEQTITYENWARILTEPWGPVPYAGMAVYVIGIVASSYHFAYGIWNFCIRWGITVSDASQKATAKLSQFVFIAVSLLGIIALSGFFNPVLEGGGHGAVEVRKEAQPLHDASLETPLRKPGSE